MNPNLKDLDDDFLYHLGYSKSDGLDVLFGDVKVKPYNYIIYGETEFVVLACTHTSVAATYGCI